MAYSSLSPEDKAAVQDLALFVRAVAGELARIGNHGRSASAKYVGNIETILGALQDSDLIPNESGLAGAQSITKAEFVNLVGYLITISATADNATGSYNTNYHRGLYAKAAGVANMNG